MDRLTLNRRTVMVSAVAGTAALLLGGSARSGNAQVQSPDARNVGYYRFRVGQIKATVLSDGVIGGPPTVYANDAPEAELQEVLRRAFLPTDHMTLQLNTLLLEVGDRRILLEAGAGATMGPNAGRVFDNLAAIGLDAGDIDTIVVSHTHPDHVGNLSTSEGKKAFPNATVYAPRADWDFFVRNNPDLSYMPVPRDFRDRFAAAIKRSVEPIAKDIELYEAGAEIVPGLTTIAAPGHTPGMATFLVHSGNHQLLLTADLAYHPVVNIDHPWRPGPDRDKDTALASRRRIFDMAATDKLLVLGFHYPFPGLGRMLKTDMGYAWVPAGWQF
ncbi:MULTISPECIES: MBL fold metallo-hydrolase [Rhizobium]|uniref:MBL fold metallo-hydrolase n=1 Tax=Rhizobium TaxID=379 RepID=UPI00103E72FF|nr:MBL fold metallo-hydrolase [Rhizobium leguminosarum]MBY5768783.1 MBL fold metallo-hydrolase [Rhizobium leguminosarum]MBY5782537.1 MBL fold metallo-hydrolase [Rhizobium leguminosarum]MBY5798066.1 MBL fold metallo-hydrolase [Rhizobium leguminosarum]NKL99024.1 MBL fold metallo-hydrolase [Rhizobium leguminosarum bv. viciae]TBZ14249.1 MBL fold metallo-hydrolase [Rhizobium leguminosarum bv. viciae]